MEEIVEKVYEKFNEQRKQFELKQADEQDMQELNLLEDDIKSAKKRKR
jgi:hypothetical protein